MNTIEQAIELTEKTYQQFIHTLSFVPETKLHWSPAPTAKSVMKILAHTAVSAGFIAEMINGKSSTHTAEQAIAGMTATEAELTTKEQALKILEDSNQIAISAMKKLKESDLMTMVQSPFMTAPISMWMNLYWRHFDMHGAQIDYLQTCWGDLDFHFGE